MFNCLNNWSHSYVKDGDGGSWNHALNWNEQSTTTNTHVQAPVTHQMWQLFTNPKLSFLSKTKTKKKKTSHNHLRESLSKEKGKKCVSQSTANISSTPFWPSFFFESKSLNILIDSLLSFPPTRERDNYPYRTTQTAGVYGENKWWIWTSEGKENEQTTIMYLRYLDHPSLQKENVWQFTIYISY